MGSRVPKSISELGEVVGGSTPSTKIDEYWGDEIPWISPKDLTNHNQRYIKNGARSLSRLGFSNSSLQMLPAGTVLFSSRAPIGYVAIAANPLCTNQGFKSVIPNDYTDGIFLYYLLKANSDYIASFGSGTTFKEVSGKTMREIELLVPESKEEQAIIGNLLSCIDEKIELNNQLNDYLAA